MQGRGEKWEASNEAAVIGTVRKRREIENQKKKREEENMSLKNNKYARRLAAALMTGAMMVSMMGMTAMAQGESEPVGFDKVLDMTGAEGASVPDVTFTYTIQSGEAVPATENTLEIKAGVGNPTVGEAEFTYNDTAADKVTKHVSVNFPEGAFGEPGIYRYVVTEKGTDNDDITNDQKVTRYLDVYVDNTNTIIGSQLLTTTDAPDKDSEYDTLNKSTGYTNSYKTYALTLDKVVKGNMGNMGKSWSFTIEFVGPANASFTMRDKTGDKTIKLNEEGKGSATFELKDEDPAKEIKGIPSTVTYKIIEDIGKGEGYTTTYTVNNGQSTSMTANTEGTNVSTGDTPITMGQKDNAVVVTNSRTANAPATGVILNIAPYILMVALAGVLAFFFLRKRHYEM